MVVDQIIDYLLEDRDFASCVTAYRELPEREADYRSYPKRLQERLVATLKRRGIHSLYAHQAEAIEHVLEGRHVVVVTPTASGKTLCYNIPVVDSIMRDAETRALYLFPTKALSQDQMAELHGLVSMLDIDLKSFTYDGDTTPAARRAVRHAGHIVITNPDMLHTGILPHHTRWVRLFENLRYVVIDELHTYRGVFGSHVANVVRRLRRVCRFYGSNPQFICCSATIANPKALASMLIEDDVVLVNRNGAPRGRKHIILYNPPVVNAQLGIRRSSRLAARDIAGSLVKNNVQTIVFARSRTAVEVLLTYLQADLPAGAGRNGVRGYRGGYLPLERRSIERGLRDGSIQAVVATNALELGIDIGGLDAAVLTGYPGTIASTWQQMGRAGRTNSPAIAILVAGSAPLDQYVVGHPGYVFDTSPESGLINSNNLHILSDHIKCAAFELPFADGERFGAVESTESFLQYLAEAGLLHHSAGTWHWISDSFPAEDISLRSALSDNVVIVDQGPPARVIGEVDRLSAPTMVHEQAIYLHGGVQYQVEKLDLDEKKAYVRAVDVDYYTDAELAVNVAVLDVMDSDDQRARGEVAVTYLPTIFKKIKFDTHENVGWGKIHLPEDTMHTTAYWFWFPAAVTDRLPSTEVESGLTGLAHVLGNLAPLYLMCDPQDIRVWPEVRSPVTDAATIFLFDHVPGGVGLSDRLHALHRELLVGAGRLVCACPCSHGCPSCVGPTYETTPNAKLQTIGLIDYLLRGTTLVSSGV